MILMQEKNKPLLLHTIITALAQWNKHFVKWMQMLQGDDDHCFVSTWSLYKPAFLLL